MPALETQVGQIYINNKKLSRSFVSLFSEKNPETDAEIFILLEIATENQDENASCEKIAKSLAIAMRRNYKKPNPNAFENAVAQINDELASLAGQGRVGWFGKMNACIAVRQGDSLCVATAGKIHAYLFRNKQFSDVADTNGENGKPNALKTFENFAAGKIARKDILIFTTKQLFNYVSIERLQKILSDLPIAAACQAVANLIKQTAEESLSFGTFIVELGFSKDFITDDATKILSAVETKNAVNAVKRVGSGIKDFVNHGLMLGKNIRIPKIDVQNLNTKILQERAKEYTDLKKIKELPRVKKFFLLSATIFVLLLIISIAVAARMHFVRKNNQTLSDALGMIQRKIESANAAFIYNDQKTAIELTKEARDGLNALPNDKSILDQENKLSMEITELENSAEHVKTVQANKFAEFTNGSINSLAAVGKTLYMINTQGDLFAPYSLNDGSPIGGSQNSFTAQAAPLNSVISLNGTRLGQADDGSIYQIDPAAKTSSKTTWLLVPQSIGLAAYGSPTKLYTLDKKNNQITYADASSGPVTYMNLNLHNAMGLAIDSSIYILTKDGVLKYISKQQKTYGQNGLSYGDNSVIHTDATLANVYILDPSNKRLIVLNKGRGDIVNQYTSPQFGNVKDFIIDEKNKIAYILSDQTVFIIHL